MKEIPCRVIITNSISGQLGVLETNASFPSDAITEALFFFQDHINKGFEKHPTSELIVKVESM